MSPIVIQQIKMVNSLQTPPEIKLLHDRFDGIEMVEVPLFSQEIKGVERLREVEKRLFG